VAPAQAAQPAAIKPRRLTTHFEQLENAKSSFIFLLLSHFSTTKPKRPPNFKKQPLIWFQLRERLYRISHCAKTHSFNAHNNLARRAAASIKKPLFCDWSVANKGFPGVSLKQF
jgi:hypothetical protein